LAAAWSAVEAGVFELSTFVDSNESLFEFLVSDRSSIIIEEIGVSRIKSGKFILKGLVITFEGVISIGEISLV